MDSVELFSAKNTEKGDFIEGGHLKITVPPCITITVIESRRNGEYRHPFGFHLFIYLFCAIKFVPNKSFTATGRHVVDP